MRYVSVEIEIVELNSNIITSSGGFDGEDFVFTVDRSSQGNPNGNAL